MLDIKIDEIFSQDLIASKRIIVNEILIGIKQLIKSNCTFLTERAFWQKGLLCQRYLFQILNGFL